MGREIGRYKFDILDHANEQDRSYAPLLYDFTSSRYNSDAIDYTFGQGRSYNKSQTNAPRLYEFTSRNGIMVSASAFECGGYVVCNLFPRFASSTPRGCPTLTTHSKMNSTRGALRHWSRSTSTPSLQFSSLPRLPHRASELVLTIHSPLYPPCSQNPWPPTFPSCSPMSRTRPIGTAP